ncbi:MAG: hypothetical protein COB96_06410 [Planctomycetota bacterium]|nr:MAG: hypothetical protein COB96_06410 [Planctomycetota bacterium]
MNEKRSASVLLLWAGNILLGVLLSLSFLGRVTPTDSWQVASFGVFGLVSSIGILSLVPGCLSLLLNRTCIGARRNWSMAAVWTLAVLVLFIDTRLHGFYGFHINAMVMSVLFTPGVEQSISIGWADILPLGLLSAVLLPAQAWFAARQPGRAETRWAGAVIIASLFSFIALQFWEAGVDPALKGPIAERIDAAPLTMHSEPLSDFLGQLDKRELMEIPNPALPANGPRPNFLILVLDCLRADAIDAETAPNMFAFQKQSRNFKNHLSAGNWTQHGIFTLLYGIHGSYWKPALRAKASPPLIRSLDQAGYDFRIYAAAAQTFPAFRSTCWVDIEDSVFDDFPGRSPAERDAQGADEFARWLSQREDSKTPFFSFFLLDATHQPYDFPDESVVFTPYEEEIRYIPISFGTDSEQRQRIRNRYRNSVHYADTIVAQILLQLEQSGEAENTVVIITGDHGEEFWEHGIWGHATNFSREQVEVPFMMRGPGIPPGTESRPTSHIDLPRTLLALLGADQENAADWSLGENMLNPLSKRVRVSAGWQGLGIRMDEQILFLPTPQGGRAAAFDLEWQRLDNTSAAFEQASPTLKVILGECERFLKP